MFKRKTLNNDLAALDGRKFSLDKIMIIASFIILAIINVRFRGNFADNTRSFVDVIIYNKVIIRHLERMSNFTNCTIVAFRPFAIKFFLRSITYTKTTAPFLIIWR